MRFACNLDALSPEIRETHFSNIRELLDSSTLVHSPDGATILVPPNLLRCAMRFVEDERMCCPFLNFTIEVPPFFELVTVRIRGPQGVGSFLRSALRAPTN